jgi:hypothetical protein
MMAGTELVATVGRMALVMGPCEESVHELDEVPNGAVARIVDKSVMTENRADVAVGSEFPKALED